MRPARDSSFEWIELCGANTLLAHRLLWLAEATGHQYALKERLLRAYFCEGLDIGNVDVLAACAHDVDIAQHQVREFLRSDDGVAEVQGLLRLAAEAGITAVPTFVFDGRWVVPGAQDPETFVNVVRRLLANSIQPSPLTTENADA